MDQLQLPVALLYQKLTTRDLEDMRRAFQLDMDAACIHEERDAENTVAFCTERIALIDHILKERAP